MCRIYAFIDLIKCLRVSLHVIPFRLSWTLHYWSKVVGTEWRRIDISFYISRLWQQNSHLIFNGPCFLLKMQTTCYTTHGLLGILQCHLVFKPQTVTESRRDSSGASRLQHPPSATLHLHRASASPPPLPCFSIHPCRSTIPLPSSSPAASHMCVLAELIGNAKRFGLARHYPSSIRRHLSAPLHFCFLLLLILIKGLNKEINAGWGFTQKHISSNGYTSVLIITHC